MKKRILLVTAIAGFAYVILAATLLDRDLLHTIVQEQMSIQRQEIFWDVALQVRVATAFQQPLASRLFLS